MLEQLVPKLDFAPPLADFLYKDPYASVRRNVQFGLYLGLNDVNVAAVIRSPSSNRTSIGRSGSTRDRS